MRLASTFSYLLVCLLLAGTAMPVVHGLSHVVQENAEIAGVPHGHTDRTVWADGLITPGEPTADSPRALFSCATCDVIATLSAVPAEDDLEGARADVAGWFADRSSIWGGSAALRMSARAPPVMSVDLGGRNAC